MITRKQKVVFGCLFLGNLANSVALPFCLILSGIQGSTTPVFFYITAGSLCISILCALATLLWFILVTNSETSLMLPSGNGLDSQPDGEMNSPDGKLLEELARWKNAHAVVMLERNHYKRMAEK